MWLAASSFSSDGLNLLIWAKIDSFFPKLPLSGYFFKITATGNETKTMSETRRQFAKPSVTKRAVAQLPWDSPPQGCDLSLLKRKHECDMKFNS